MTSKTVGKTIRVRLKKSAAHCSEKQKASVRGLGLRRVNSQRTLEDTAAVRGMIKKVIHLLEIQVQE